MARMQVIESCCDRCLVTETMPFMREDRRRNVHRVLPDGWLYVSGETSTAVAFEMELCRDCKVSVLSAAGAAARR
jgi:membrane-bound ClpP family serine protease